MTGEPSTAIANLVFRYARAYDERDLDALGSCFVDDATFSWRIVDGPEGGPFVGRDAIVRSNAASLASQTDRRRHVMTNLEILGDGDERRVRSYMTLFAIDGGRLSALTTGVYDDVVVRGTDDTWRFSSRQLLCDLPF